MSAGLHEYHRRWTSGPDFDRTPGEEVRRSWHIHRKSIDPIRLTRSQRRKINAANRKVVVFDAVHSNIVTTFRNLAMRSVPVLALGLVLNRVISSSRDVPVWWQGFLTFVLTSAVILAAAFMTAVLDSSAARHADRLNRRRPWLEPVPNAFIWAFRIVAGALCTWYAVTHVLGGIAGAAWGVLLIMIVRIAGAAAEGITTWRWRNRYGILPSSYVAIAAMLRPAAMLATNRRAWTKQAKRKELADQLRAAAATAAIRYHRLARTAIRSTGDRATILAQASSVQQALLEHRRALFDVTSQKEYDALTSRIRQQVIDLSDKNWDNLPTTRDSHRTRIVAGTVINAATSAAFGIAVNASSAFLPNWMKQAGGAYSTLGVMIALTAIVVWRERGTAR